MCIVVELKRDATPEIVLNQLFKLTPMQESFGIINLAIVDGKPVVCSTLELIKHFVRHRRDVVTRRTEFELRKAKERMHILEGFRIVLLNLDEVIALIKASSTPAEARQGLRSRYGLSEIQAQAILDLKLQRLTGMERLAIEQEYKDLATEIERLKSILADTRKIDTIISSELQSIAENFGDKRRTEIVDAVQAIEVEDLLEDEEMVVTLSHKGYIKRTHTSEYRVQRRGGVGISGVSAKDDDDFVTNLFVTSTLSELLIFTDSGRLYWLKVYEIPEASRTARGRAIINLLNLKEGESLTAVLPVKEVKPGMAVFMATQQGTVKKTELTEFSQSRRSGVIACTLDEGDHLIGADLCSQGDEVILCTKDGMSIRFAQDDVRSMGRAARGVRGISLDQGDLVVGMTVVRKGSEGKNNVPNTLLTVCENGYGKRTLLEDYRVQGRGGKGVIDIHTSARNGPTIGSFAVNEASGLMLITSGGKIIRLDAREVSVIGRNTQGVKLIELEPGEKVAAAAHVPDTEEE
jgi:DNA gyrase subunit A